MSRLQMLRELVNQRLSAAAEEIFGLFEGTIAAYEEELSHLKESQQQRELLDGIFNPTVQLHRADVRCLLVIKEEVPSELSPSVDQEDPERPHIKEDQEKLGTLRALDAQQLLVIKEEVPSELSPSLDQEDPERPHMKEDHEEIWTNQEGEQVQGLEEADKNKFPSTPVYTKSEDEEEPLDCGGSEPIKNLDPHGHLQPDAETEDINDDWQEPFSEAETEDSDSGWKDTRAPESGLDALKSDGVHESNIRCNPGEKSFSCSKSGTRYRHKHNLQRHMRVHTGEKPFGCDVCGKRFTQHGDVKEHMRVHTGEKPFACDVCGKRFTQRGTVKKHMRVHTGERPFGCDVCGKRFTQRGTVKKHMRVHTGERPFGCDVCGKRFTQNGDVKKHMRVHTGERPFGCDVCGKRFALQAHVKSHMRLHT